MNFLQSENVLKSRLVRMIETLNHHRSHSVGIEAEDHNRSTLFLQMQKEQIVDLQDHFERYRKTLPVFGFNKER